MDIHKWSLAPKIWHSSSSGPFQAHGPRSNIRPFLVCLMVSPPLQRPTTDRPLVSKNYPGNISATRHPIQSMFSSRIVFFGTTERMVLFPVRTNPRWRSPPSWKNFKWPYLPNRSSMRPPLFRFKFTPVMLLWLVQHNVLALKCCFSTLSHECSLNVLAPPSRQTQVRPIYFALAFRRPPKFLHIPPP